jgi:hypothetical protein
MNATNTSVRLCAIVALLSAFASDRVWAGAISANQLPTLAISVGGENPGTWNYRPGVDAFSATPDGSGAYDYTSTVDQAILQNRSHVKLLDLDFNPDPFVLNNVLVTNTTAIPQSYLITVGLPTSFGAPNLISGNITTSVIDGGADGATISSVTGQPIYKAVVDATTVATLQNNPFSVSTPGSSSASASFGPTVSALPVGSSMSIVLTFQLTPGDTAAILSRFDVVPEPSAILLCCGAVAFVVNRQSRARR